jgi:flagellar basal-body rod modification protein FlgD
MTTVYPISSATTPKDTQPKASGSDGLADQDTFLKLLVAQLKYQDPMSPADGTQFLTQTAQFTELETLQKIAKQQDDQAKSGQMLAAATMVGRSVTYSLGTNGTPTTPTGTSLVDIRGSLSKDAPVGAKNTISTTIYTKGGAAVPLDLQFTKAANGWTVQPMSGGQKVGGPLSLTFDATGDHVNNNLSIASSALDGIGSTAGGWPNGGLTLAFGTNTDATRLQLTSGSATIAVAEQNGNDGNAATGIVTGIHMTADGPQLVIGGHDISINSVTDVQS